MTRFVEICLRWYAITLLRHLDGAEVHEPSHRHCACCSSATMVISVRVRGMRVLVVVVAARATRRWSRRSRRVDAVLPALVQVDRARVRDREDARVVDGADHAVGFGVDRGWYSIDDPLRSPTSEAGARGPDQYMRPAAGLELVGLHELAHGVVEPVAEPLRVVGRERELVRRARDLRAEHERVLRVHDRPFGVRSGELRRMRDVPLVELVVAGDEHGRGAPIGAARRARPAATSTRAFRGSR